MIKMLNMVKDLAVPAVICNCLFAHDKSQKTEPRVTKFSTHDEGEASWSGAHFGFKRSKVKVAGQKTECL